MGLFSHYVAYRIGRRRAERRAERAVDDIDERDPDCVNYAVFCRSYGSCDGQACEYTDDST